MKDYPKKPGVYIMKDKRGAILYVGKAKNLANRLKQYFVSGGDGRPQIPFLLSKVNSVETIVVNNEKEALLLEDTLIKEHRPRYNVLLKDDKTYIALKITTTHTWPMVSLVRVRGKPKDKNLYFGPYTSALAAKDTLEEIRKLFPLRQCSDQEFIRRTRPCILHQMKRCIAPCVNKCTPEEYKEELDKTIRFLKGDTKEVLKKFWSQLEEASEKLEYEKADVLLHKIRQIEKTLENQQVNLLGAGDFDVWGLYREGDSGVLSLLTFRQGKLMGATHFPLQNSLQEDEALLESAVWQYYSQDRPLPKEVWVPSNFSKAFKELFKTKVVKPIKGKKKQLLEMAEKNAKSHFVQKRDKKAITGKILLQLQEKCHLSQYPDRIECLDTSNISGAYPTASMVAFTSGEPDVKRWRTYKIKTTEDVPNDILAMTEVLTRRYQRAKEEEDLPHLIIVDGGKGQLNAALKVLRKLDITTVDVIGLAKDESRHDRGMTEEQIFLPLRKDPLILPKHSPILFLLQKIRDHAHDRAISLHKKQRSKALIKSQLDDIPGIGKEKKKALLKAFGSVKNLLNAKRADLENISTLSQKNIDSIVVFIQQRIG